jgi:hypothetical protein
MNVETKSVRPLSALTPYVTKITLNRSAGYPPTSVEQTMYLASEVDQRIADLTARLQTAERALSLARRATNGWACYAKRDIEHREIADLHREISEVADSLRAGLEPQQ